MLKDKEALEEFLNKKTEKIIFDKAKYEGVRNYLYDQYDIPNGMAMDMLFQRVSLKEKNDFILFCLLDGIDKVQNKEYKKEFFTDLEIEQYSHTKLEDKKIKFPLKIRCDKVSSEQWIGATDTNFLMLLRKEQLIRYNANAQRVMKRIIKGENIILKLIPNKLAISAIKNLLHTKSYIPTTITLNIPYDSDADFYYDEEERELVINSIETFDISDGYHRYLAICEERESTVDFNYPMEIRITNFSDEKVRQFIYQEDQKTKMSKANSRSMNTNRYSNNVIDKLNETSTFNLRGQIGRNEGSIDYAAFSDLVEYFYFRERRKYSNIDIINVAKNIKEEVNELTEYNTDYLTKPLGIKELAIIFYIFDKEKDISKACEIIDTAIKNDFAKKIKSRTVSKALFTPLKELI